MLLRPLKERISHKKKIAPWYNDHTHALKQALLKLERKWRSTNLQVFFLAWKESVVLIKSIWTRVADLSKQRDKLEEFKPKAVLINKDLHSGENKNKKGE